MNIIGVLLAAGNSRRFGSNKLAYPLNGQVTIGLRSAGNLINAVDSCIAVVRPGDKRFAAQLQQLGYRIVIQPNPRNGMGDSLALAVRSSPQADAWLFALADMPWIQIVSLRQLVTCLQQGAQIVTPVFRGQRGHPVGFSKRFRQQLAALNGDSGAKMLIRDHARQVHRIDVEDEGILRDVDTVADLQWVKQKFQPARDG